jgi:peptidoglycan/xylan/chitin deacetylase (PgdA/CDA1 family)
MSRAGAYNELVRASSSIQLRQSGRAARLAKTALTKARTARWRAKRDPRFRILTYHRVSNDGDPLAIPVHEFRRQMEWLADERLPVAGVSAGLEARAEPSIALTFDDGFADATEIALPVLRDLGFGATLYIVPAVIDGDARFNWYGGESPPTATWDLLATAVEDGFEVGAHTLTHPVLTYLPVDDCRREIARPPELIEARLGVRPTTFSYPAGVYGERERQLVEEAAYASAVTSRQGAVTPGSDALQLPRIPVERSDSLTDFASKVYGGHDRPIPLTDTYRRLRKVRRERGR